MKKIRQALPKQEKFNGNVALWQRGISLALAVAFFAVWFFGQSSLQGLQSNVSIPAPSWGGAWILGIILIVVLFNAVFVAAETAVSLLKAHHVRFMRDRNEKLAGRLEVLFEKRLTYIAACKLGSDFARLLVLLLILVLMPGLLRWLNIRYGIDTSYFTLLLLTLIVMIPVGLINLIAELVPRSYATLHPHAVALRLFRFIQFAAMCFSLPAKMVTSLANVFTARFGGRASFAFENEAEEEIKTLVESAEETGEIESDERELLHSVFEFTDTVAKEVMTPRVDMDAMPVRSSPEEIMQVIVETGHSRIPLFEDTDDQIVGIVHAKDLLMAMLNGKTPYMRNLMRPPLFVPENKPLQELLAEMRGGRSQMAVVQDEFGGTAGIVTIEDIVEELVGDIIDEYDVEEPEIVQSQEGWLIDGRTDIDDVNEEIGSEFSTEEFDTLGGMVFGLFGRQPRAEETIEADGYRFTVVETDGKRINRLKVEKLPEPSLVGDDGAA